MPEGKYARIELGKYLVQNLFYPALLGSFLFSIIQAIAEYIRNPENAENFLTDPAQLAWLKGVLAFGIILFYLCDYLYSYVTEHYKWQYFLIDAAAICTLVFSFFAIRIDVNGPPVIHNLTLPFIGFFAVFMVVDWVYVGIYKPYKSEATGLMKFKFFKKLAWGQTIGFLFLGTSYLLFCFHSISDSMLAIGLIVVIYASVIFYFCLVQQKQQAANAVLPSLNQGINQPSKITAMSIQFEAGINIAIKIPKSKYEKTVAFYRDILKLEVEERPITNPTFSRTHEVKFGNNILWLDCVDNYTHSETWLQLRVPNVEEATSYLLSKGVDTCDELEELPENMHWIMDPAGTVFNLQQHTPNATIEKQSG